MSINADIVAIIKESETIAVVGASRHKEKAAHEVPEYLQSNGYKIIPVNPFADEILGEKAVANLGKIDQGVDIIQIFRPSEETPKIVAEAVKLKPKLIWLQLGIKNEEAKKIAEEHNIPFVMDRCLMMEHTKIFGRDKNIRISEL
ncbi:MAG: CoA-binding protein [Candidatus Heimdallarchaeota archaeon]|nr:CoA-binding protein [Candidatus Heimdallarchaeota archaeon]